MGTFSNSFGNVYILVASTMCQNG